MKFRVWFSTFRVFWRLRHLTEEVGKLVGFHRSVAPCHFCGNIVALGHPKTRPVLFQDGKGHDQPGVVCGQCYAARKHQFKPVKSTPPALVEESHGQTRPVS